MSFFCPLIIFSYLFPAFWYPSNTVIYQVLGKEYGGYRLRTCGALRYAVRARAGVKNSSDGKSLSVNGKMIGHIYNDTFISCEDITPTVSAGPEDLSYGVAAFVESVSKDPFKDLCSVFSLQDACDLMATAMVKATDPRTKCIRIASKYGRNSKLRFHPDRCLSANRLVKLFT